MDRSDIDWRSFYQESCTNQGIVVRHNRRHKDSTNLSSQQTEGTGNRVTGVPSLLVGNRSYLFPTDSKVSGTESGKVRDSGVRDSPRRQCKTVGGMEEMGGRVHSLWGRGGDKGYSYPRGLHESSPPEQTFSDSCTTLSSPSPFSFPSLV